jgi:hypothetical protein
MFQIIGLDIETAHAETWAVQPEIDAAVSKVSRNKPKAYKTPEKQQEENERIEFEYIEKCEEAKRKVIEKSALSLAAPIACIGFVADGRQFHFSTFEFSDEEFLILLQTGVMPFTFESQPEMLQGFSWWLNAYCGFDTQYVGHNAWNFDYSRLRLAYLKSGLPIPIALSKENKHNCHDTMRMFSWFSGEQYTSLEIMCAALEIPFTKTMNGAEVPDAVANKEFMRVTLYNMADAWACYRAFIKML